jgi:uncharacterized protein YrrD
MAVSRFKFQVSSAGTPLGRASELEGNIVCGVRNASVTADRVTDICCEVSGDLLIGVRNASVTADRVTDICCDVSGDLLIGVRNVSVTADRVTDICCDVSGDLLIIRGVVGPLPVRDCLL